MNKSHDIAFPYISYHNPLTHLFILSTDYSAFYPGAYVCKARETICHNAPSGMRVLRFNQLPVPTHIEKNKKVYFFIKRLRHTDVHFFFVIICLNYLIIYNLYGFNKLQHLLFPF